jgi:hypothetical protein
MVGGQPGIIVGGGGTSHGNDGPWNVVRGNYLEGTTDGIAVYKSPTTRSSRPTRCACRLFGVRVESAATAPGCAPTSWPPHRAGVEIADSDQVDVRLNRFVPGSGPSVMVRNSTLYVVEGNDLGGSSVDHPGTGRSETTHDCNCAPPSPPAPAPVLAAALALALGPALRSSGPGPAAADGDLQRYLVAARRLFQNADNERALEQIQRAKALSRGLQDDVVLALTRA